MFAHLPKDLQRFLMHTAMADHLTPALMSALTGIPENAPAGKPSVAAMARELFTRNLFISSIGAEGSVIRYHALFREFLLKTFQAQCGRAEVRTTYGIAARWFTAAGDPVRAIDLLISSNQREKAVREIESNAQRLISGGRSQTLLRWMQELPRAAADRPWYLFARAVSASFAPPSLRSLLSSRPLRLRVRKNRVHPPPMLTPDP